MASLEHRLNDDYAAQQTAHGLRIFNKRTGRDVILDEMAQLELSTVICDVFGDCDRPKGAYRDIEKLRSEE